MTNVHNIASSFVYIPLCNKQYMQVMMIMEYLHNGDLSRHLRDIGQK